jgi:hypothetical protein
MNGARVTIYAKQLNGITFKGLSPFTTSFLGKEISVKIP